MTFQGFHDVYKPFNTAFWELANSMMGNLPQNDLMDAPFIQIYLTIGR